MEQQGNPILGVGYCPTCLNATENCDCMETFIVNSMEENKKDWFKNKLVVGSYPYLHSQHFEHGYDYIINVSDEFYWDIEEKLMNGGAKKTFWFPMSEQQNDIGLNSIYGALVTLYNAEKQNKTVYLHCHAGSNRSQIVNSAFHYMKYNEHYEGGDKRYINRLVRACHNGYLYPKEEMEKFLKQLGGLLDTFKGKPMGGLIDEIKIQMKDMDNID